MKTGDYIQAENHILDPFWRLNNIYCIIDKAGTKSIFHMNWAQEQLYQGMWHCNIILKARQH